MKSIGTLFRLQKAMVAGIQALPAVAGPPTL